MCFAGSSSRFGGGFSDHDLHTSLNEQQSVTAISIERQYAALQ
jgi:hypothetical protein